MKFNLSIKKKSNYVITTVVLLTALCLFTISCKKEQKEESISIEITRPVSGFLGSFGDSIIVRATIQSESIIKSVEIELVDENDIIVNTPLLIQTSNTTVDLNEKIVADNYYAPTGTYYVEIRASTGNKSTVASVPIYLQTVPKVVKGIYVLTRSDSFSFTINKVNSLLLTPVKTVSGDYSGSAISSIHNCLYTAGITTGPVHCFNVDDWQDNFQIQPTNPLPMPSFTTLSFSDEYCYVGYRNGAIRAFDYLGTQQYDTHDDPYFIPQFMMRSGDYLLAELLPAGAGQKSLAAYYYPSGVRRQVLQIDFDVQGIGPVSADESLLFTIRNGHIEIYKYSIAGNYVNLIKQGIAMELHSVLEYRPGEFLLASTQGLYKYRKDVNTLLQAYGAPCQSVEYDDVNNLLYCVSGSIVRILDANSFTPLNSTINSPDSILAVRILYNK